MNGLKLYLHNLTAYDYIGFVFIGITVFLLFMIAVIFLFKRRFLSFFLFMVLTLVFGPAGVIGVKYITDNTLRNLQVDVKEIKPLHFSNALLLVANLTNKSKIRYKKCFINFKIYKKSNNKFKNIIFMLKPSVDRTISLAKDIVPGDSITFKHILYNINFNSSKERYKVKGTCYWKDKR